MAESLGLKLLCNFSTGNNDYKVRSTVADDEHQDCAVLKYTEDHLVPPGWGTKDGNHSIWAEITANKLYPTCRPGLTMYTDLNKCMNLNPLLM